MLGEAGDLIGPYREAFPVDYGAGGVGDGERIAAGNKAGLAVDHGRIQWVGLGSWRSKGKQNRKVRRF